MSFVTNFLLTSKNMDTIPLIFRTNKGTLMDLGAAVLAFLATAILKIPVMLITTWLIYKMYKATAKKPPKKLWILVPEDQRSDYKMLYVSMILFFFSEIFCGLETYILMQSHPVGRFLHSITSAIGMGFFGVALYNLLNAKAFKFLEKGCVMRNICGGCPALAKGRCRFTPTILILSTLLLLACIPPFFASTEVMIANPSKYILPFESINNWYDNVLIPTVRFFRPDYLSDGIGAAFFMHEGPQIFDYKFYPALVMLLTIMGIFFINSNKPKMVHRGISLIVFGSGVIAYTYNELILYRLTGDLFMAAIGHEISEMLFLLFLADYLPKVFSTKDKLTTGVA